uniref:hypothetical protein n=1 Tax=Variovorax sp. BK018 TaxID=3450241 RepID=UPI004039BD6F
MKDSIKQINKGAFSRSVAGEEDPGAAIDVPSQAPVPGRQQAEPPPTSAGLPLQGGDEAPEGTPGTGEALCRVCGGTGKARVGTTCPSCGGTGHVIVGIGGG